MQTSFEVSYLTGAGSDTARIGFDADVPDGTAVLDFRFTELGWQYSSNTGLNEWRDADLNWNHLAAVITKRAYDAGIGSSRSDFFNLIQTEEVIDISLAPNVIATGEQTLVQQGDTVSINVGRNDSDLEGEVLSFALVGDPSRGTVEVSSDGFISYTADTDFTGIVEVEYSVSDGTNHQNAILEINVGGVNYFPIVRNDFVTVVEDNIISVDLLQNDDDPDDDRLEILSISQGANGTVEIVNDGMVTYTPDADFNGTDNFTYTVEDGNGGSGTATVKITVDPVNDDPVAVADTASTDEGNAVTVDILSNDTDADDDTLTVAGLGTAPNGSLVDNGDGTVTYTPDADFNGNDSFTYTVEDGNGGSDMATVAIDVSPVNEVPVVTGTALDAAGNLLSGVTIWLNGENTSTDAAGAFAFELASDMYGRLDAVRDYSAGDPAITASDALDVLRLAVGLDASWGPPQAHNFIAADVNQDGQVTASDALDVLRHAVGLETENAPSWVFIDADGTDQLQNITRDSVSYETGINLAGLDLETADISLTGILLGNMDEYAV